MALAALLLLPGAVVAQSTEVVHIGAGPVDQATPLIYGVKGGIYKKYGISVEVVKLANGSAIASAVAGGSLELGQASALSIVTAFAKGLPFTVIGNLSTYDAERPDFALLVAANAPIHTAKDLEGKPFGAVSLQDQASVFTFAWLDAHGVDRSTIKYAEVPASAALAAMEQNRIVAATVYEPFLSADLASGKVRALGTPYDAVARRFSTAVLFGGTKWVGEHHDAVERFLRATQDASTYVAAHENESAALIAEFTGVDPASIANIRHSTRGVLLGPADLQPVIDVAARYKVIPKTFAAQDMICACALHR
jgi:ABC-type nitrate/sulfonate/bicarbonate transport system substrate-binding protein